MFGYIIFIYLVVETATYSRVNLRQYQLSTSQSNTDGDSHAHLAIDGFIKTCSRAIKSSKSDPWWRIEFDKYYEILKIKIVSEYANNSAEFKNLVIFISKKMCNGFKNNGVKISETQMIVECSRIVGKNITVRNKKPVSGNPVIICELMVYLDPSGDNIAYQRPVFQSGTLFKDTAKLSVDGDSSTCNLIRTMVDTVPWWRVMLDDIYRITNIDIQVFLKENVERYTLYELMRVFVSNDDENYEQTLCASTTYNDNNYKDEAISLKCIEPILGRYVTIKKFGGRQIGWLTLCEVEIYSINIPLDLDEQITNCPQNHYKCKDAQCIHEDWLCDGVMDCLHLDDEKSNCKKQICGKDEFKCTKRLKCIEIKSRCDGIVDCPDQSDEDNCYAMENNFLKLTFNGDPDNFICSHKWTKSFSIQICHVYFDRYFMKMEAVSDEDSHKNILVLKNIPILEKLPRMFHFRKKPRCRIGKFVKIFCGDTPRSPQHEIENELCGTRGFSDSSLQPYIAGGTIAKPGAWPWHVQVFVHKKFRCGGSIIHRSWVLTAAQCVADTQTPIDISLQIGTNIRDDPTIAKINVSQQIVHPEWNPKGILNNIALLRLAKPITFSDFVRPVCLHDRKQPHHVLLSYRLCVASGLGHIDRNRTNTNELHEARMNLMSRTECITNLANTSIYSRDHLARQIREGQHLCGGAVPTVDGTSICNGDIGGPFVCKDKQSRWIQVGLIHGSIKGTVSSMCPNTVLHKVDYHMNFIKQTIGKYNGEKPIYGRK